VFIDIRCWQHQSNLSASAAALFDTVLIARHIPYDIANGSLEHDQLVPSLLPSVASCDTSVPGDCSSLSSSAFSDLSCVETQSLDTRSYQTLCAHSEDFLSDMGSISSTELSSLFDDINEWPFVHVHDNHSLILANRHLPVTENFVAELKPRSPVPHGLILIDQGNSWATLLVRPAELVKADVSENSSCDTDSVVEVSSCKVPEKRKEVTLYISTVTSSVSSVEETETIQKVAVGARDADTIAMDDRDSHWHPENMRCDTSDTVCTVNNGRIVDSRHGTSLYRHVVKPDFSTVWSKYEDCGRTRLLVCQRELVDFVDYVNGSKTCSGVHTEANKDFAIEVCPQSKNNALFKTSEQLHVAPAADDGRSATVQSEKVGVVKYERCDIDNRLSVELRDAGRSRSAEPLIDGKHSSHSGTQSALQTDHQMTSTSSQPTNTQVLSNEIHRAEGYIHRQLQVCRSDNIGKYLADCRMSVSCDNIAHLNLTPRSQRSGSQGNVNNKMTENCLHGLYRTERHCPYRNAEERDWRWSSVKDISSSHRSVLARGRLSVVRDASASHARHHSCDWQLPDAPDSPGYLELYGRGDCRYSCQNRAPKSASSENVSHLYSARTAELLNSWKKLKLLPTSRTPPLRKTSVIRQTVVARQSPLTSRIHYTRAASEPHRVTGILSDYTHSHAFTSNNSVKLELLESKYSQSKQNNEYVSDASDLINVSCARRTSLDASLTLKCADEGLSDHDMYSHGVSDVRQTVTESDTTDITHSEDADTVSEQQSADTCRHSDSFKSSVDDQDTAARLLIESSDSNDQLHDLATGRSEDLSHVQSVLHAVSTLSLYRVEKPAELADRPSFEVDAGDMERAGMVGVTASNEKCSSEQLAVSAVVAHVVQANEVSEISCKKRARSGCIEEQSGTSDMQSSDACVREETMLDEDSEASKQEDCTVTESRDTMNTKGIMCNLHGMMVEDSNDDLLSITTSDTAIVDAAGLTSASHSRTTASTVEQGMTALSDGHTTPDSCEFSILMAKDTADSANTRDTWEMGETVLNNGTLSLTTLDTCDVTASEMSDSEHAGESLDSSTMAVAESGDGAISSDESKSTVTEMKDFECSGKTSDTCKMSAALLSSFEMTNSNVALHSGITTNRSKMKLVDVTSEPSELAVTLPDDTVCLRTAPNADDSANIASQSEKSQHFSEMVGTILSDAPHSSMTPSISDMRTTKPDDAEDARMMPVSDQVIVDANDLSGMTADSVSAMAVDSSVHMLAARNDISTKMFSSTSLPTAAVPDDCADLNTEISASVSSVPDARLAVMAGSVIDAQVEYIPTDKADAESDVTACSHICQVIEPCEEMSSENSCKPVTVLSSICNSGDQTADITADEDDVQVESDSDIASRQECVQSVNMLRMPVHSNEMLASDVPGTRHSLPDTSLDLSRSLADSVSRPPVEELADHRKANQHLMLQTSDQVNSDGSACMHAVVAVAY